MEVMFGFMSGIWRMAWYWRLWVACLMLVNMLLPLFFIQTVEAQLTLAVFMVAAMTQMVIFQRLGFVRLLGIGHVYWVPMLLWLLMQDYSGASDDKFVAWLFVLILFNSMSLLMDILDVFRYWRGERKPL